MRFQNFGIPFRSFRRCDFKVSGYHFEALGYLPGGKSGLQEVWWGKIWPPGALVSLIGRRDVLGGDLGERPAKFREAKSGFGLRGSTSLGGPSGKKYAKGLGLEGGSRGRVRLLFQTPEPLHTARHASDPSFLGVGEFLTCAKGSNPRHGSILGHGYVPLDEIYVAVPLRVLRSEFSFYP